MNEKALDQLRFEYWATAAARHQDPVAPCILDIRTMPTFYDYLLQRGYSRFQLSRAGIGRNVEA